MSNSFVCRSLREEDDGAVRRLVESAFPNFPMGRFWDWKYPQNPSFDRSLAAVAEQGGKVVGCNHWLPRKVRLSNSIVVDAMLGASIAVIPEYRKRGVGRTLIHFLRTLHHEKKPSLMYMFTDPELRKHFHTPVAGYVPAPSGTALYTKILNWQKVKLNVAAFNKRVKQGEFKSRLANVNLTVAFKARGAPPLCLHLSATGVETDVSMEDADVTILSDMATFDRIRGQQGILRTLIGPLLTGRLRLRGDFRKMLKMYRNIWVFREILSKKIT